MSGSAGCFGGVFSVGTQFVGVQKVLVAPGTNGGVFALAARCGALLPVDVKFHDRSGKPSCTGTSGTASGSAGCFDAVLAVGTEL